MTKTIHERDDAHNAMYSTAGDGRWFKRVWQPQCTQMVFMADRCQGSLGHKGEHWAYRPDGSYAYDDNEADPIHNGCLGSIPPGHARYVNPVDKFDDHHLRFSEESEVTDPAEIARLEAGEIGDGESITRPCQLTEEQIRELKS